MKDWTYKFEGKINSDALFLLKDCISKTIRSIHFHKVSIDLTPHTNISTLGGCFFRFYDQTAKLPIVNIEFQPRYYDELRIPFHALSTVEVRKSVSVLKPLREARYSIETDIPYNYGCCINYPNSSPVIKILFFGYHQWGKKLNEITSITLEELNSLGFVDFPSIEIDSIELISLEHENNQRTMLLVKNGGFDVIISTDSAVSELLRHRENFINFKEQHEVS